MKHEVSTSREGRTFFHPFALLIPLKDSDKETVILYFSAFVLRRELIGLRLVGVTEQSHKRNFASRVRLKPHVSLKTVDISTV